VDIKVARVHVACGIEHLDKTSPGWASKVDLDKLDLEDNQRCIVGQLVGNYAGGRDLGVTSLGMSLRLGFNAMHKEDRGRLERAWGEAIVARRASYN